MRSNWKLRDNNTLGRSSRHLILHESYIETAEMNDRGSDIWGKYWYIFFIAPLFTLMLFFIAHIIGILQFLKISNEERRIVYISLFIIIVFGLFLTEKIKKEIMTNPDNWKDNPNLLIKTDKQLPDNIEVTNPDDPIIEITAIWPDRKYEEEDEEHNMIVYPEFKEIMKENKYTPKFLRNATKEDDVHPPRSGKPVCISEKGNIYPLFKSLGFSTPQFLEILEQIRHFYNLKIPKWDYICDLGYIPFYPFFHSTSHKDKNAVMIRRKGADYYYYSYGRGWRRRDLDDFPRDLSKLFADMESEYKDKPEQVPGQD